MHESAVQAAIRAINKHGRDAYLIGVSDDSDSWDSSETQEIPIPVKILQTSFAQSDYSIDDVNPTDLKFLMSGETVAKKSMKLRDVVHGVTTDLEIGFVDYVQPGETLILQKIFARN